MAATVRGIGEVGLIERIRHRVEHARAGGGVLVGIGDDAAVLRGRGGDDLLFACDMLVEGTHFHRARVTAEQIGWKALACNVSDIAAMGGEPRWAVVSVGLPRNTPVAFADGLARGLRRCADRFKLQVVGGDTTRAPQVVIDIAILGTVPRNRVILRRGARVGDDLFVTGRLGGSYRSGRHARFIPRVREAQTLTRRTRLRAMMDLSDGLASDAWQLSRASRVVWRLEAARIPIARDAAGLAGALYDGEDFELLFAVGSRDARRVPRRLGACPVTRIGRAVRRGIGVELMDARGRVQALRPCGFRHF